MKSRVQGRVAEVSMGSRATETACTACGLVDVHVHKHGRVYRDGEEVRSRADFPQFSTSVVPGPRCEECQTEMRYLQGTDWACENATCGQQGLTVTTSTGGMFLFGMVPGQRGF